MASLGSLSHPGSFSDDEILVSVVGFSHGHHRHHGRDHHHHHHHRHHHHHERRHGHHQERVGERSRPSNVPGGIPSVDLGDLRWPRDYNDRRNHEHHRQLDQETGVYSHRRDGREVNRFSRLKNPVLRRLAHRAGHLKQEMRFRALLRRHGGRDQRGLAVEGRDEFPSHLLEDGQDMIGPEARAADTSTFLNHVDQALRRISDRGWSRPSGAAVIAAEQSAAHFPLQLPLTRRHGRKRKHQHQHPRHHQHHRNCPYRIYGLSAPSYEMCSCQRVSQRPADRFESGPEAQAAVSAGPSSTYLEMLAQCLIDYPEAGPSAAYEGKLAECLSVNDEAGPSATYEEKLAERLMDSPEPEAREDKRE